MTVANLIINYSRLVRPFSDVQNMLAELQEVAGKILGDSNEVNQLLSRLGDGLQMLKTSEYDPRILTTVQHQAVSLLQSVLAENAASERKLNRLPANGSCDSDVFEIEFGIEDWRRWIPDYLSRQRQVRRRPFLRAPDDPIPIPNDCRIALLGDWASGMYGAPVCAQTIENDPEGFHLIIHLGDTYYSGVTREAEDRFLRFWPKVPNCISRSLNGNHDMYSGGEGYFDSILCRFNQSASYFALQNDHWILIGLDSAYQNEDLTDDQVAWLSRILAHAGGRKVLLFTHHPAYMLVGPPTLKLVERLRPFLEMGRIFGWYWGHEHRCIFYDRHPRWGTYTRCVGNGGVPELRVDFGGPELGGWRSVVTPEFHNPPPAHVEDMPNVFVPGTRNHVSNGFTTLSIVGPALKETVHNPSGGISHEFEPGPPRVSVAVPTQMPAPEPVASAVPDPASEAGAADQSASVQFNVCFPKDLVSGTWSTLLAYIHVPSALNAVQADVRQRLGPEIAKYGKEIGEFRETIQRGTEISFVPQLPGCRFNPRRADIVWLEDWHRVEFRVQADPRLPGFRSGKPVNGRLTFYVGPVIVAEAEIWTIAREEGDEAGTGGPDTWSSARVYQTIFLSYAREDELLVMNLQKAYRALGSTVLRDITDIRSGQNWQSAVAHLISVADIFQLYWSKNSEKSQNVQWEWRYALEHRKEQEFIRPLYWETKVGSLSKPDPDPPLELKLLHFTYLEPLSCALGCSAIRGPRFEPGSTSFVKED